MPATGSPSTLSAGEDLKFNIPRSLIEPNINNLVKLYYSLKLASTGKSDIHGYWS